MRSSLLRNPWPRRCTSRVEGPARTLLTCSRLRSQALTGSGLASPRSDGRARLSKIWLPSGGIAVKGDESIHDKLIRAGFLRQAHSGIFHLLPLGLRVQDKLEKLIDKHMSKIGASKLALSSISSQALWTRTGRLEKMGSEVFKFEDRKESGLLLSPTHEEEITTTVASSIKSYKDLPIRVYQISRKYRDEPRPRQGLLRSREFLMKDLYTFDLNEASALSTYNQIRKAYADLFDELKIPYLVAEASSGDIGGDLSHEFHFATPTGEDHIISCDSCSYVANEELAIRAEPRPDQRMDTSVEGDIDPEICTTHGPPPGKPGIAAWYGITRDRSVLVQVWHKWESEPTEINTHAVKKLVPDLDAGAENPLALWEKNSIEWKNSGRNPSATPVKLAPEDSQVPPETLSPLVTRRCPVKVALFDSQLPPELTLETSPLDDPSYDYGSEDPYYYAMLGRANFLRIRSGDRCAHCKDGTLRVQRAVELGHTFHLGTKYSSTLGATVALPQNSSTTPPPSKSSKTPTSGNQVPLQMGCHGIGVSRMIAAVADTLADSKGLIWPRVMAPYTCVIIPGKDLESAAEEVYDSLLNASAVAKPTSSNYEDVLKSLDVVIDDRQHLGLAWKLNDADLIGYPVIIVVGKGWKAQHVEVQCRKLGFKKNVSLGEVERTLRELLGEL